MWSHIFFNKYYHIITQIIKNVNYRACHYSAVQEVILRETKRETDTFAMRSHAVFI